MVLVGRPSEWTGSRLLDVHGARVGTIVRVRDAGDGTQWLVVDLGRLATRLVVVPAGDAIGWSGQVTVPYSRATVRLAPRLWRPDDPIDASTAAHLRAHYAIASPSWTSRRPTTRTTGARSKSPARTTAP